MRGHAGRRRRRARIAGRLEDRAGDEGRIVEHRDMADVVEDQEPRVRHLLPSARAGRLERQDAVARGPGDRDRARQRLERLDRVLRRQQVGGHRAPEHVVGGIEQLVARQAVAVDGVPRHRPPAEAPGHPEQWQEGPSAAGILHRSLEHLHGAIVVARSDLPESARRQRAYRAGAAPARELDGHPPPHRVACDVCRRDAERIECALRVVEQVGDADGSVVRGRPAAVTEGRQGDRIVVRSQERHHVPPHPLASEDAVQEDEGFTGALAKHRRFI